MQSIVDIFEAKRVKENDTSFTRKTCLNKSEKHNRKNHDVTKTITKFLRRHNKMKTRR